MAINDKKKAGLMGIFKRIATPKEAIELEDKIMGQRKLRGVVTEVKELAEDHKTASKMTLKETRALAKAVAEGFSILSGAIVKKLDEVKEQGIQGSKGQENYALTLQNMAKSIAEGLEAVRDTVDKKPVPVWRWPQYLYSGMRDKQFSPINPATDGIGVGDFDKVTLNLSDGGTIEHYNFYTGDAQVEGGLTFKVQVIIVYADDTRAVMTSAYKSNVEYD